MPTLTLLGLIAIITSSAIAFPSYGSLAGLSQEELNAIVPTLPFRGSEPPPAPLDDTSAKLVNDNEHPWKPLTSGDIRGPCPGLNTLASHGWIPRDGVATPAQIITACQEAFNMDHAIALFVTYGSFLVDGNVVTNKLSIGGQTSRTGPSPGPSTLAGGLNTHDLFEGDASITRADFFFGNNHDFNETLWDQFVDFSNRFGGGKYNFTVAGELRYKRIQDSIATNPNFTFVSPRFFTAYAEATFPVNFFIDGRHEDGQLDLDVARGFFQESRFPDGFFRASRPRMIEGIDVVAAAHPQKPGRNVGRVNNFVVDPTSADFSTLCLLYENFVNKTIKGLYQNPTGVLRDALNNNLDYLFQGVQELGLPCTQVFPFGKN